MTETIRAFVALEIPGSVRDELAAQRDGIEKDFPAARWTSPPGWHLTLKFLGETDRAVLDQLVDELGPRLRGLGAVQVRLHGGGFFPSPKRPRVAWIGGTVDGAAPVVDAVEEAAARAGFEREKRPWALH